MIEPPPRDANGQAIPHNHAEIRDADEVIRRISEKQIVVDGNGNRRISSMAYKDAAKRHGGMSIDLKQLIEKDGLDPKEYVTTPRWMGSVLFKVADLRNMGFKVGYDPIEPPQPDPNPYHGEVWSEFSENQAVQKLKSFAVWFVELPDVNLI